MLNAEFRMLNFTDIFTIQHSSFSIQQSHDS